MDALLADPHPTAVPEVPRFKSRPGALAWSFRKSRDRWKAKYMKLKAERKRHTNRVADVTKSREQWRSQAEAARQQLSACEAEIAALRTQIAALEDKKKSTRFNRP
jgi:septal ring factor EnvC (AmiA/AmiB activator)